MSVLTALAGKLGLVKLKLSEGRLAPGEFYAFKANTLEGEPFSFASLKGKVVLITNVACMCGFTSSNYEQLVAIHKKYDGKLEILAFPSNEFGKQEPKPPAEIREFVNALGVKFVMMEKTFVNGPKTHPVYVALKKANKTDTDDIAWNFETKFLVSSDGQHVARFSKAFEPNKLIPFLDQAVIGASASSL